MIYVPYWITSAISTIIPENQIIGQLYLINGGPGTPGSYFLPYLNKYLPFEIIMPDPQGTGYSHELQCPDGSQNVFDQKCIDGLDREFLKQFTITGAAKNLHFSVESLYHPNVPVMALATSYGTAVMNRYLQIYNPAKEKIPLRGVVLSSFFDFTRAKTAEIYYDRNANKAFESLLEDDAEILEPYFPEGLVYTLRKTMKSISRNQQECVRKHFPEISGRDNMVKLQQSFFQHGNTAGVYFERPLIPAVLYRILRCSAEDVKAVKIYLSKSQTTGSFPPGVPKYVNQSLVLNNYIVLSELYDNGYDCLEFCCSHKDIISSNASAEFTDLKSRDFPVYEPDSYAYTLAKENPRVPVLVLAGTADLATPYSSLVKFIKPNPSWYLASVPLVGHSSESVISIGTSWSSCPILLSIQFFANPSVNPVPNSCLGSLPPTLDWTGNSTEVKQVSQNYFGTPSLYGVELKKEL